MSEKSHWPGKAQILSTPCLSLTKLQATAICLRLFTTNKSNLIKPTGCKSCLFKPYVQAEQITPFGVSLSTFLTSSGTNPSILRSDTIKPPA